MRTIAFLLVMSLGGVPAASAGHRAPAFDFNGTAMVACDVNDGPASQVVLEPAAPSDGRLYILVHDAAPPALHGVIAISDAGYAQASASLSRCEGRGNASCRSATAGSITIDSRTVSIIQGHLRFRIGDGPWREGSFRAVITSPPQPLLCG